MRAREWLTVAPAYAVPGVASFILVPVLFALLGADEYGRWVLIYGLAAGIPQLSAAWLEASTVRYGHRGPLDPRLTVIALGASVVLASAAAAVLVPGLDAVGVATTGIYTAAIASYVLAIARLQVHLRFGSLASTAIVRSVLNALLAAVFAAVGHTAVAVAAGSTLGYLIGVALTSIPTMRLSRATPVADAADRGVGDGTNTADDEAGSSLATVRPSVGFAAASSAVAISVFILSVGDRFILSLFRPIGEVGVYAATYSLADLAGRLPASIVIVTLRPRAYRAWDAGRAAWARERIDDATVVLGWVGIAAGLVLLAAAFLDLPLPIDPRLVGPISAGLAALFAANVLGIAYTASGRQGRLARQIGITAAGAVVANLLLVPALGAAGAALVTLVMYGVQLALARLGMPPGGAAHRYPRWLVAAIVAIGLGLAATSWWSLPGVALVILGVGLACLAPWIASATRRLVRPS
jgi:O-antigen/teichoic acid export membrane protein